MRRVIGISCLLFAWLCANGAMLEVVQVFAWGRMFANHAREMSMETALTRTFDPGKPCELCLAVQNARAAGREHSPAPPPDASVKLVLIAQQPEPVGSPGDPSRRLESLSVFGKVRRDPVPVPPPRSGGTVMLG